jgi:NADH-quinone oxidoreductase subunit M
MLWMFRRVMFGPLDNPQNQKLADLNLREILVLLLIMIMMFWMGLFPGMFLDRITPSVEKFISQYNNKLELAQPASSPLEHRVVFTEAESER